MHYFSLPRKVRRSLRSIADPKLSIKSRFENPPLWQYSDKNLRIEEPCLEKFYTVYHGRPFVSKLKTHIAEKIASIRAIFLPRILAIFSALWVFSPHLRYESSFFSCVRSTQTFAKQTRIHLRTTRAYIYKSEKNNCFSKFSSNSLDFIG